jgi:hypothetical protein
MQFIGEKVLLLQPAGMNSAWLGDLSSYLASTCPLRKRFLFVCVLLWRAQVGRAEAEIPNSKKEGV